MWTHMHSHVMFNRHQVGRHQPPTHHSSNLPVTSETDRVWGSKLRRSLKHTDHPLSRPGPYLPSFLPFILSFVWAIFISSPPPLLLSPLISYCASWRNVHMPRIWMKCHCSVCWKALCPLSSPLDMSEGRKGLHGRVIKSLSVKETQKDEERKGENPETIFNSDSPTVPPPQMEIWTQGLSQRESRYERMPKYVPLHLWERDQDRSRILCLVCQLLGGGKTETTACFLHASNSELFTIFTCCQRWMSGWMDRWSKRQAEGERGAWKCE